MGQGTQFGKTFNVTINIEGYSTPEERQVKDKSTGVLLPALPVQDQQEDKRTRNRKLSKSVEPSEHYGQEQGVDPPSATSLWCEFGVSFGAVLCGDLQEVFESIWLFVIYLQHLTAWCMLTKRIMSPMFRVHSSPPSCDGCNCGNRRRA